MSITALIISIFLLHRYWDTIALLMNTQAYIHILKNKKKKETVQTFTTIETPRRSTRRRRLKDKQKNKGSNASSSANTSSSTTPLTSPRSHENEFTGSAKQMMRPRQILPQRRGPTPPRPNSKKGRKAAKLKAMSPKKVPRTLARLPSELHTHPIRKSDIPKRPVPLPPLSSIATGTIQVLNGQSGSGEEKKEEVQVYDDIIDMLDSIDTSKLAINWRRKYTQFPTHASGIYVSPIWSPRTLHNGTWNK